MNRSSSPVPPPSPSRNELVELANTRLSEIRDLRSRCRTAEDKVLALQSKVDHLEANRNSVIQFPPFVRHQHTIANPFDLGFKFGFGLLFAGLCFWVVVVATLLAVPTLLLFFGAAAAGAG